MWRCSCRSSASIKVERGHEPFGADAVGDVPGQEQGMLDFRSELASAWAQRCLLRHLCTIEEPNGVFAVIASGLGEFIQQQAFFEDDALRYRGAM